MSDYVQLREAMKADGRLRRMLEVVLRGGEESEVVGGMFHQLVELDAKHQPMKEGASMVMREELLPSLEATEGGSLAAAWAICFLLWESDAKRQLGEAGIVRRLVERLKRSAGRSEMDLSIARSLMRLSVDDTNSRLIAEAGGKQFCS